MTTLDDLAQHARDDRRGGTATRGPATRRGVLSSAAIVATASGAVLVAGCGSSGSSDDAASSGSTASASAAASTQPSASASAGASGGAGSGGTVLGAASSVPVGGGTIFAAQKVVVTQPTAGTYKAFSSTCTHRGCQVNTVANGLIKCPCHGSDFSITDGSPQAGPAQTALPAANVSVDGANIVLNS
ncbi:Rieske (2Fe-2S) protein [Frankia sp. R82]|uniref:Rieske (2Fe-2S) protein n=1 Tax=Frankia sp. R82 TaxID=2950553 RepID=UPI002044A849|nr:Rieske (2Fe-2S) protein [Frankia sp. R82]MCM3883228.1 Rieske (2Fe-2S) protein [Frankia sp. R82]